MNTKISNSDDTIDSRDVIDRIEQLQALRQPGPVDLGNDEDNNTDQDDLFRELATLEALQAEAEGYASDWHHGTTLIRDSYFTDYTRELLQDIGVLPPDLPSYVVIDWEATADNIRPDYTAVDFGGVEYWVR